MKIGIDISQVVYQGTGVATYTQNLVRSLLESKSDEYVLFGSSLGRQQELVEFVKTLPKTATQTYKLYSFPSKMLSLLWNKLHQIPIERFVGKVDVFHTSDWIEPPANTAKVTTIHDVLVYKYPEHLHPLIVDTQKAKLNWVKKESAAIIADSKTTKQDIIDFLKIEESKIHVIPLGVGEVYYPQKIDAILKTKQKYQIKGDYLLCVGTREPRKNLAQIFEAFKLLKQKNLTLVIVGNFGWGKDIKQDIELKLLGYVPENDLPALYCGATAFIYPPLYEGFGLPVLEALACGTVVITSDNGSLAEIAQNIAIRVSPQELETFTWAIKKVINLSKKDRELVIKKGLKYAQQFTWEKTAQKTLEVYKSVL